MPFELGDQIEDKKNWGHKGVIVPIPDDYSFVDPNDPLKMARLVYVHYYDTQETVLIPESRIKQCYPSCCKNGVCDCEES